MSRYADIDKAMELAARTMVNGSQVAYVVMGLPNFVENILNNAEVEAEPRKPGRWITDSDGLLVCSECEAVALQRAWISDEFEGIEFVKSPYCPNCGAAMDKVEREEGLL